MKFYLTFGQKSPARNGWISVYAGSEAEARDLVFREYGNQWAGLYPRDEFELSDGQKLFPAGELGVLK